jgi:acetyl/propionyl-CoA carboxylase alpha subunit
LSEYCISGVESTIGFHEVVLQNRRFQAGDFSTGFLQEEYPDNKYHHYPEKLLERAAIAAAVNKLLNERKISLAQSNGGPTARSGWVRTRRKSGLRDFGGSR